MSDMKTMKTSLVRLLAIVVLLAGLWPPPAFTQAALLATPRATITVNSVADTQATDGQCTLREALINANADNQSGSTDCAAGSGADTVVFSLTYPAIITLTARLPMITWKVALVGPGADRLTLSGNGQSQILLVIPGGDLTVQGMTLSDGYSNSSDGGAINNEGQLTLANTFLTRNVSTNSGGALYNAGAVTVTASTFYSNTSDAGGAIMNFSNGLVNLTNSSLISNTATGWYGGGGILNLGTLTVHAGTLYGNRAAPAGPGENIGNGVPPNNAGVVWLYNTLLVNTTTAAPSASCTNMASGSVIHDGGYNLENSSACGFSGTSHGDQGLPFWPPANNGGGMLTMAPRRGSPAIDYIPANGTPGCGITTTTDQRGISRPLGLGCDVGAIEADEQPGRVYAVNQTSDAPGVCDWSYCSLRQAISTIQSYPPGLPYTVTFFLSYPNIITLTSPLPALTSTTTLLGPGANLLTVSGNNAVNLLVVNMGASLTVAGLNLARGHGTFGSAIFNSGLLAVVDTDFDHNIAGASGGALFNSFTGVGSVWSSTFSNNNAGLAGGALVDFAGGWLLVVNSTFYSNSVALANGGAIYADTPSTLRVVASTFYGNSAGPGGAGAVANGGYFNGTDFENGGSVTLEDTLLANNQSGGVSANCFSHGGTLSDGSYNLEDVNTCSFGGSSYKNTQPGLTGPADNGGPLTTVGLPPGSAALDRIPKGAGGCGTTLLADERNTLRPQGPACDIGAFERDEFTVYLPLLRR